MYSKKVQKNMPPINVSNTRKKGKSSWYYYNKAYK